MFERFSQPSRQVLYLAREGARSLCHNYVGSEHVLLALMTEDAGRPRQVLADLGVGPNDVRTGIELIAGHGTDAPVGHIPFHPETKNAFELALREADRLNCKPIEPEHFLLGLVDSGTFAAALLHLLGAGPVAVRHHLIDSRLPDQPAASWRGARPAQASTLWDAKHEPDPGDTAAWNDQALILFEIVRATDSPWLREHAVRRLA
jgi:ATP-dependent Clp protease ATP-binding subunit ClpA